jgi:NADH-quinone oxidoreductase subunit M
VPVEPGLQMWLFAACALAFAIKVPMFPFHTWLPDAHVEAPTAGSVILAGVLLKMGGYGFLRLAIPLFPQAAVAFAPWIGILAVIGSCTERWSRWCSRTSRSWSRTPRYRTSAS